MAWYWIAIIAYAACFVVAGTVTWLVIKDDEGSESLPDAAFSLLAAIAGPLIILVIVGALIADGVEAMSSGMSGLD